jgi:hypothetical protein
VKQFAIVYYTPDPFVGERVAIGAFVHDEETFFLPGKPPCVACLGQSGVNLVNLVMRDLSQIKLFELPSSTGPQVSMGYTRQIPESVASAADWVRRLLTRDKK